MTVFQSNQLLANINAIPGGVGNRVGVGHGLGGSLKSAYFKVDAAAAILVADSIEFGMVPKGFRVLGGFLKASDIGGATTVLNVGDAALSTRLFAAATVGQAGGVAELTQAAAFGYLYPADTLITGNVTVAPGDAAGSIELGLIGVIEGQPS